MKDIYVVLDMGYVDTSVLAHTLASLDVHLAKDNGIYKINRKVLALLDETSMSTHLIDESMLQNSMLVEVENAALKLLQERMAGKAPWGFNDGRTAKILLFWQRIFAKLNLQENYIIVLDNPLSFARSYSHVSGDRLESCLLYWVMHMVAAIEGTHNKKRTLIAQQSNISTEEITSDPVILTVPVSAKIYFLLMRIARNEIAFADKEFNLYWQEIMVEFKLRYPLYYYANTILQRTRRLNKAIHKINKSLPWKFILPLRVIEKFIRQSLNSSRERQVKL